MDDRSASQIAAYHQAKLRSRASGQRSSWLFRLAFMALGILCAAGFAPFDFWPAAIAALVLLLRCAGAAPSWRSAWGTGWWFGLGLGLASFPWLAHAFSFQSAMPYWLGWVAVAGLGHGEDQADSDECCHR